MKQKVITPPISTCFCGSKAKVVDWNWNERYLVMCDNNHTLSKECGSHHKAICLWNNRVAQKLKEITQST